LLIRKGASAVPAVLAKGPLGRFSRYNAHARHELQIVRTGDAWNLTGLRAQKRIKLATSAAQINTHGCSFLKLQ